VRPSATFDPVLSPDRAGWTWDPTRRYDYLWWDGDAWTARKIGGPPAGYYKRPPRQRPTFVLAGEPRLPLVRRNVYAHTVWWSMGWDFNQAAYLDIGDGFLVLGGRRSLRPLHWLLGGVGPQLIAFAGSITITARPNWLTFPRDGDRRPIQVRIRCDLVKVLVERGFEVVGT